jgi:uncharacterized membrane protein YbhN (UPF0104 family)
MTFALFLAAVLAVGVGLAHSILGERYILIRLFKRDQLPPLFGGTEFTRRTLRFAWHITTLAWFGFAAILVLLARSTASPPAVAWVIAATFLASALLALVPSRGRHLSWIVFLAIGLIALAAALAGP